MPFYCEQSFLVCKSIKPTLTQNANEQIKNEWSNDESNASDIVLLPPDNIDSLKDDEKVLDDDVIIDDELPSDVCGTVQVQNIF